MCDLQGWTKCPKMYKKCTVLSALDFKTDSTKSQCANPQSCLQFSHTAQLGPDFTPYYHIYKCNIIFFKFILGQPHVQISIVSDRPTDSPLVWLVFSVIRFVPISRCPMTEFARVFMTIPINRVGEVKKWTSDQWPISFGKFLNKTFLKKNSPDFILTTRWYHTIEILKLPDS